MKRVLAAAHAAALLSPLGASADTLAVATDAINPRIVQPKPSELAPYEQPGTGRITGRFNLAMNGTKSRLEYVNYAVYLLPAVQWSYVWAWWLARAGSLSGSPLLGFAPWTQRYVRKTVTDNHGNFVFTNVPPGKYVLGSLVVSHITGSRTTVIDDPTIQSDNSPSSVRYYDTDGIPRDQYGKESYDTGPSYSIQHNYTYNVVDRSCNVRAALEAVVTVAPGAATTNAPIQIAGSDYTPGCD